MSKPNQNQEIKNSNKGSGQNKSQPPKPVNREDQMNQEKDQGGKRK